MQISLIRDFRTSNVHKVIVLLVAVGLLTTLIAAGYYLCYRFHGHFRLTEGEAVLESNKSYHDLRAGWVRPNPEFRWAVQLEQVALRYSANGDIAEIAASLFLYDQNESKGYQGVAGYAHPVTVGKLELVPVAIGVSPAIDLFAADGSLLWRGAPKLDILDKQALKVDYFTAAETELAASFYPASRIYHGQMVNASLTPTNPVFLFELVDVDLAQAVPVGGEPVQMGEYSLQVPGYRYWLEFEVTSTIGLQLLHIGLGLLAVGLLAAVVVERRRRFRGIAA